MLFVGSLSCRRLFLCPLTALRVLFYAEDFLSDIRPELLRDVIKRGGFHLGSPITKSLVESTLLRWVIRVRQCCCQSVSTHLRPIETRASRVSFGDKGTGQ